MIQVREQNVSQKDNAS